MLIEFRFSLTRVIKWDKFYRLTFCLFLNIPIRLGIVVKHDRLIRIIGIGRALLFVLVGSFTQKYVLISYF